MTQGAAPNAPLMERARELAPLIESRAAAGEHDRRLSEEVVQALRDAELFWMTVPRPLGGADVDLVTAIEVLEEVSRSDGSTGWALMTGALATGAAACSLPDAGVEALFGGGRKPIVAGMSAAGGVGEAAPGGFRLKGNYGFASGSAHADWICAGFFPTENGKRRMLAPGQPDIMVAVLPRDRVAMKPNWDVMGLAATRSDDYEVPEQLVEGGACYSLFQAPLRGRGTYQVGVFGIGAAGHGAVVLGIAKRAIEEAARLTRGKKRLGYPQGVSEHPIFQLGFAHHEAAYQAARAFLVGVFTDAQHAIDGGTPLTPLQHQRFRQSCAYAHAVGSDVVNFCYRAGGAQALRNPSALGRCMRDLHGATQHVTVDPVTLAAAAPALVEHWASRIHAR